MIAWCIDVGSWGVTMRESVGAPKFYSIQALRGIAAFLVVIAHSIEHGPSESPNAIVLTGRFGVEIFFVISGFVIMLAAGAGRFSAGQFIARRIWRVVPLYWMTTFLVAAMALASPATFATTVFDLGYLIKSLAFIPMPLPGTLDWRPLFKLGWTLNYEIFFYLLMAMTFWAKSARLRGALVITALLACFVASFFVAPSRSVLAYYANLSVLPFAIGVMMATLGGQRLAQLPGVAKAALAVLAFGLTLLFYQTPYDQTKVLSGHLVMAAAAGTVVAAFLALEGRGRRSFLKWCGDISYSLYLTHMFVVGAGWVLINRLYPDAGYLGLTVMIAGIIGASLVVAHLSYRILEKPLLGLFPKQRNREPSLKYAKPAQNSC